MTSIVGTQSSRPEDNSTETDASVWWNMALVVMSHSNEMLSTGSDIIAIKINVICEKVKAILNFRRLQKKNRGSYVLLPCISLVSSVDGG